MAQTKGQRSKSSDLQVALAEIARTFGVGSVMRLGEQAALPVEVVPTGSNALNVALGIGGYPRGRVVELHGAENSGKTTLALHAVAEAQKLGLACAYIDAEHALDLKYAEAIGVDVASLLFAQPASAEEALEIMLRLTKGGIGVIVLDSIAAMATEAELRGEIGDLGVGQKARLLGQAMRKLVPAARESDTLLLLINQNREAIGVMFGSPIVQPGGKAVKYAASIRASVSRGQANKRTGTDAHEIGCKVKIVKNRLAPPLREAEFAIVFGKGIREIKHR